jgi:threonine dehydrogenase-like Zn-dependent dehydrogenase
MKGLVLDAKWDPKPDYAVTDWEKATGKAITGSSVWRYPKLEVREKPMPQITRPGQALLEVQACGVCGSDIHFYERDKDGYMYYPGLTKFPVTTGHEFSAKVVEVSKDVDYLKPGTPVTAEEMQWCGYCTPCRNGFPNHCENLEEIGFTVDGAFQQYLVVDAKTCWPVDGILERYGEKLGYDVAAMSEPSCVAYNTIFSRAGGFKPGAYVCIFGAGPIGLAGIALAYLAGAAMIAAFEISPQRRELALKVGADAVYDPRAVKISEVLMEMSHGEGFDFFMEGAGVPHIVLPEAEKALAINAKVALVGRAAQQVPMYLETYQVRRSQFFGAQGHSGDANFPNVIRLVASGRLDLSPIITARYNLAQVVDAIARSGSRSDGKIMVYPN